MNCEQVLKIFFIINIGFLVKGFSDRQYTTSSNGLSFDRVRNVTLLHPIVERVFSRKKRFLLFPQGGSLKFTVSLSKNLLAMYPRGLNFVLEAATYYPGPTQRADLLPKRLHPPTTKPPKPVGKVEPLYVYIPGLNLRYKAKPAPKPKPIKLHRIDQGPVSWTTTTTSHKNANLLTKNTKTDQLNIYHPTNNHHGSDYSKYQWSPRPHKWNKWTSTYRPTWRTSNVTRDHSWPLQTDSTYEKQYNWTPKKQYNQWPRKSYRWRRDDSNSKADNDFEILNVERMYFDDMESVHDWKHYNTHRDRRQLFHSFEGFSKILGIDMKSCIMRAICDTKYFLLPKGYSLIQDIVRLVFSFPTISGLKDEYSHVMNTDFETCDKLLQDKCPINLLEWFLNMG